MRPLHDPCHRRSPVESVPETHPGGRFGAAGARAKPSLGSGRRRRTLAAAGPQAARLPRPRRVSFDRLRAELRRRTRHGDFDGVRHPAGLFVRLRRRPPADFEQAKSDSWAVRHGFAARRGALACDRVKPDPGTGDGRAPLPAAERHAGEAEPADPPLTEVTDLPEHRASMSGVHRCVGLRHEALDARVPAARAREACLFFAERRDHCSRPARLHLFEQSREALSRSSAYGRVAGQLLKRAQVAADRASLGDVRTVRCRVLDEFSHASIPRLGSE